MDEYFDLISERDMLLEKDILTEEELDRLDEINNLIIMFEDEEELHW